jgi:hypothetical protein
MDCPYCRNPIRTGEKAAKVGDQLAHDQCIEAHALRQSRPFRERVTLNDRAPEEGKPVKERDARELRD